MPATLLTLTGKPAPSSALTQEGTVLLQANQPVFQTASGSSSPGAHPTTGQYQTYVLGNWPQAANGGSQPGGQSQNTTPPLDAFSKLIDLAGSILGGGGAGLGSLGSSGTTDTAVPTSYTTYTPTTNSNKGALILVLLGIALIGYYYYQKRKQG